MSEYDPCYDLVVVGAGIQGSGVAQAAASAGYSVLLVDQYPEAACGTSSRSSKLIHGGLRYLESGEIKLVYECLQERALLLQNAPELVKLVPFYIPVYRHSARSALTIRAGLSLYALLSYLKPAGRFKQIKRADWHLLDGLQQTGLHKVFQYFDAQTDDRRLTQSVIQSACQQGAKVSYNNHFLGAELSQTESDHPWQIRLSRQSVQARALVMATGPWISDTLRQCTGQAQTPLFEQPLPEVDLVAGTHIIVRHQTTQGIYYVEAPQDKRAVFVMPWEHEGQMQTMIGTTERLYHGDPAAITATEDEIHYLQTVYEHYFGSQPERLDQFAGLRVLPRLQTVDNLSKRTRETILATNTAHNLVGIYGGKLTSYRATADKVIQQLTALPAAQPIKTKQLLLQPVT